MKRSILCLLMLGCVPLPVFARDKIATTTPTLIFTEVPKEGEGSASQGNISGRVANVAHPEQYKVVVYAHTDKWYVQPEAASPHTEIQPDGTWSSWTHLGYRYAALAVRSSFQPAATLRNLPAIGGDVLAKKEVAARQK